jgi:hypothetical protein
MASSGRPVDYRFARDAAHQRTLVEEVVAALLGDGLTPAQVTLLSPLQRVNSCQAASAA